MQQSAQVLKRQGLQPSAPPGWGMAKAGSESSACGPAPDVKHLPAHIQLNVMRQQAREQTAQTPRTVSTAVGVPISATEAADRKLWAGAKDRIVTQRVMKIRHPAAHRQKAVTKLSRRA